MFGYEIYRFLVLLLRVQFIRNKCYDWIESNNWVRLCVLYMNMLFLMAMFCWMEIIKYSVFLCKNFASITPVVLSKNNHIFTLTIPVSSSCIRAFFFCFSCSSSCWSRSISRSAVERISVILSCSFLSSGYRIFIFLKFSYFKLRVSSTKP